jgi:hypothetical protein
MNLKTVKRKLSGAVDAVRSPAVDPAVKRLLSDAQSAITLATALARLPFVDDSRDLDHPYQPSPATALTVAKRQVALAETKLEGLGRLELTPQAQVSRDSLIGKLASARSLVAQYETKVHDRWQMVHDIAQQISEDYSRVTGSSASPLRDAGRLAVWPDDIADAILSDASFTVVEPCDLAEGAPLVHMHALSELQAAAQYWRTACQRAELLFDVTPAPKVLRPWKPIEYNPENIPPISEEEERWNALSSIGKVVIAVPFAATMGATIVANLAFRYAPTRDPELKEYRQTLRRHHRRPQSNASMLLWKAGEKGDLNSVSPSVFDVEQCARPAHAKARRDDDGTLWIG